MKEREFQICNSETMIQFFTPSDNKNKMREVLLKYEDFYFSKMNLSQNINFKTFILKDTSKYFSIFSTVLNTF
jgi:hypothetical protein